MSEADVKQIIEALLFVADEPLSAGKIAEAVGGIGAEKVRALVDELRAEYEAQGRAFTIEELAGGYRMLTRPEYHPYLRVFSKEPREVKLSPAALETLAIVAYKQPINRAEVEAIRGVDSSGVIQRLLEYRLVRIVGRSEELGRPLLYGTTKEFLEHFGLKSIRDLPEVQELLVPEAPAAAEAPSAPPGEAGPTESVVAAPPASSGEERALREDPSARQEAPAGEEQLIAEGDGTTPEAPSPSPPAETAPSTGTLQSA
jgi:segregation and condensation protein B